MAVNLYADSGHILLPAGYVATNDSTYTSTVAKASAAYPASNPSNFITASITNGLTTNASGINAGTSPTNYTATSSDVQGNLVGIDVELGSKISDASGWSGYNATQQVMWSESGSTSYVWTQISGLPVLRRMFAHGIWNGKIIIAGGYDGFNACSNVYVSADGTNWTEIASLPVAMYRGGGATLSDGNFYVVSGTLGGTNTVTNAYVLSTTTNWTAIAGLSVARTAFGIGVLNNKLVVVGGTASSMYCTNVSIYNGSNWSEVAGLPASRGSLACSVLNGKLYAAGGTTNGRAGICTNVYAFDGTNWSEVAGLPVASYELSACTFNNKLYEMGGWLGDSALTNVWAFDGTNQVGVAGLPSAELMSGVEVLNNKIFLMGGYPDMTNVAVYGSPALWKAGYNTSNAAWQIERDGVIIRSWNVNSSPELTNSIWIPGTLDGTDGVYRVSRTSGSNYWILTP